METIVYHETTLNEIQFNEKIKTFLGQVKNIDGSGNVKIESIREVFYSIDNKCFAAVFNVFRIN